MESLKTLGGENMTRILDSFMNPTVQSRLKYLPYFSKLGGRIRKLTYFPDREDKVRVVAILDYFSQSVLKPLHHYLFRALRKIPQDCTFTQGSFKDKLKDAEVFYSIDLTAATDRFPIHLIGKILKGKFPSDFVEA